MKFNVKNFIAILSVTIATLLVVIVTAILINPSLENKRKQIILQTVNLVLPEADDVTTFGTENHFGVTVTLRAHVFSNDEPIGYVYQATGTNGYGHIEVLVAAGLDQRISAIILTQLVQTQKQEETTNQAQSYVGFDLSEEVTDVVVNSTTSANTLLQIIQAIATSHQNMELLENPNPVLTQVEQWFGVGATVISEEEITNDIVSKKETISNNLGYIYTGRAEGEYFNGQSAYITLVLAIDANGVIVGGDLPNDNNQYGHTAGFRIDALGYISNHLVGRNITDLPEATGGATNTATLINTIINAIVGVHQ